MKLATIIFSLGLFLISSCSVSKLASIAANTTMEEGDTNNDGHLTFDEYWNYHKEDADGEKYAKEEGMTHLESTTKDFKEADTNSDAKLTKEELKNWTNKILQEGVDQL